MVQHCSAIGCINRKDGKHPGVTYHRIPKEAVLRKHWIAATRRLNWVPGNCAALCSQHFEEKCFDRTGQTVRLRAGAIPTVFKLFGSLYVQQGTTKLEADEEESATTSKAKDILETSDEDFGNEDDTCPKNVDDHPYAGHAHGTGRPSSVEDENKILKRKLDSMKASIIQVRKKIKVSHQRSRRLLSKVNCLKSRLRLREKQEVKVDKMFDIDNSLLPSDAKEFLRLVKRRSEGTKLSQYPREVQQFALTLHLISPAAYDFIRSKFCNALPTERTLRSIKKRNCVVNGDHPDSTLPEEEEPPDARMDNIEQTEKSQWIDEVLWCFLGET